MSQPSYASGTSQTPLLGDTIGGNLDRAVAAHPDREALVDKTSDRRWTYRELGAAIDALATGLAARGIAKGDRVGIWAPNCAEWFFAQYATAKIGAILVNINPAYRTSELEYVLRQAGVRVLIAAAEFKTSNYVAMIDEVRPNCPALEQVLILGTPEWDELARTAIDPDRLAAGAGGLCMGAPVNKPFNSGTTGLPKGGARRHHN
ncbi:AMP-binding protein, partial [Nocardia brasiliensis]|uniref:AMP-binding protein n=1 Tax=Nocardia brasiliensis TaxID=37326 RepID=UPI0024544E4A